MYNALQKLKDSSVHISILMDRSNVGATSRLLKRIQGRRIDIYIDDSRAIAHNKIIVIDSQEVLTGSYNWTEHSKLNAENLVVIRELSVVQDYIANWFRRQAKSKQKFHRYPDICGAIKVKMYRSKTSR